MRFSIIISVILVFISFVGNSQSRFATIDTIESSRCRIPLTAEYKGIFAEINKTITSDNSAQKKIIKEVYHEMQGDFLDKIQHNNFICNEQLAVYLNRLLQEVLISNGIKDSYRILASKDENANAYNTGDGTIVIHFGLFLTIENEDELVFVIAHEVGHQHLHHVKKDIERIASLSTSEQVKNKTNEIQNKKYGKAKMAGDFLKNMRYQTFAKRREKEFSADSIGLAFYSKTSRNPKAGVTLLEKLNIADVEKDSLSIDDYKLMLNKNDFKVKKSWFEQEESIFKKYDSEKSSIIDSLKTHPDCTRRIAMIKKYAGTNFTDQKTISNDFSQIKQNSAIQNLINLYDQERYGISLYESFKLYKNDIENQTLKDCIYINLSKILESKSTFSINRYVPKVDGKNNSESLNLFITFINNIKIAELQLLINSFKS